MEGKALSFWRKGPFIHFVASQQWIFVLTFSAKRGGRMGEKKWLKYVSISFFSFRFCAAVPGRQWYDKRYESEQRKLHLFGAAQGKVSGTDERYEPISLWYALFSSLIITKREKGSERIIKMERGSFAAPSFGRRARDSHCLALALPQRQRLQT